MIIYGAKANIYNTDYSLADILTTDKSTAGEMTGCRSPQKQQVHPGAYSGGGGGQQARGAPPKFDECKILEQQ